MRTAKFRAWDKANKRMYQPFILTELFQSHNHTLGGDYRDDLKDMEFKYRTIGLDFMQFTGLLDKNGKEIYEGYVVKAEFWGYSHELQPDPALITARVGWDDKTASYALYGWYGRTLNEFVKFEVIGNIYENPELLNKNEKH